MNNPVSINVLKDMLREGVATVVFEKLDGTQRRMKCTLDPSLIPVPKVIGEDASETQEKRVRAANDSVTAVWDLEQGGWRSFRNDSVLYVEKTDQTFQAQLLRG